MSAKARKRHSQLKAYARKRTHRPEPTVENRGALKVKPAVEKRMIRDHMDILQNVEFSLVNAAKDSSEIDDSVIEQILRHAIHSKPSEDPVVTWALNLLKEMRQQRSDISDQIWSDALRVIYTSLRRHSSCEPGCRNYLRFVSAYVG
jgi:hypothetical protein